MKFFLFFNLLIFSSFIEAQVAPNKYFIGFNDKNGTPYSITQPQQYLSQRALDRRNAQSIPVTEQDLPVNPSYVNQIKNVGVTILNTTKWLNGVTVYTNDHSKIQTILTFPFVKNVLKNVSQQPGMPRHDKFSLERQTSPVKYNDAGKSLLTGYNYGPSLNQIHMMNGDGLHNAGYRGEGKLIAVLDAGFSNVDIISAFDSLRNEGRLIATKDFENPGGNVFSIDASHGTMVLSTMAGNIPGEIIGTAPKASYLLLRSEDEATEYILEEYNWVSAAEYADSAGADIINSSLGYDVFDDPTYDHNCAEMNGNTTAVTIGANIAASKGILVVNSAGNSGGSGWTCVVAPADGNDVLAVGAVDSLGIYAPFSANGVDTSGRVKPNVAAQGQDALVCGGGGGIMTSSGTSYSSPLVAGLSACLWQAQPESNRNELFQSIERSSSHYSNPDSLTGYGIPDFEQALLILASPDKTKPNLSVTVFPNPFTENFTIQFNQEKGEETDFRLSDVTGKEISSWKFATVKGENYFTSPTLTSLNRGVYILSVYNNSTATSLRVIKK